MASEKGALHALTGEIGATYSSPVYMSPQSPPHILIYTCAGILIGRKGWMCGGFDKQAISVHNIRKPWTLIENKRNIQKPNSV